MYQSFWVPDIVSIGASPMRPLNSLRGPRTPGSLFFRLGLHSKRLSAVLAPAPKVLPNTPLQPMFGLTSSLVGVALQVTKRLMATALIKLILMRGLRRFLALVGFPTLELRVSGAIANFSLLWAQINTSPNEVYAHPLWPRWIIDLGMDISLMTPEALGSWVDRRQVEPYGAPFEVEGGFLGWLGAQTQSPSLRSGAPLRSLNLSQKPVRVASLQLGWV
jgi:hypothetical protein